MQGFGVCVLPLLTAFADCDCFALFPVFPLDFCRTRLSTDYKSGTSSRRYRGVASSADAALCRVC